MVSSTFVDALASPTNALKHLFEKSGISESNSIDFPKIVSEHFSSVFASDDALDQIPSLDIVRPPHTHAPLSLVRFRAMVQDTSCSPEMYLSSLGDLQYGGWGLEDSYENLSLGQLDHTKLKERSILWAINIPGECDWCSRGCFSYQVDNYGSASPLTHPTQDMAHKYPIPESEHIVIQLKVYGNFAESLRPTDTCTFVGILTFEPIHSEDISDKLVPTLHVLFHRLLPKPVILSTLTPQTDSARTVRDAFVTWLSREALGGDRDAAEWVLLSCIQPAKARSPALSLSITLSNFPRPTTSNVPTLSHILSEVLPLSLLLPLTLECLNERNFEPESRDEDLHSGILQIPRGSTIIATEVGVKEGELSERGLQNVQALRNVATLQTLRYKFPFSCYSFPTDIRFITVTDGKRSLFFEANIDIPIHPDTSSDLYKAKQMICWPSPEMLAAFRELIVRSRIGKTVVDDALSQHIKETFVRDRQSNRSITPDDLVRQMSISRLVALSRQESDLSAEAWTFAKELDARRKSCSQ
ncbi:hypothetical protein M0805_005963 [Coniferiporia weirii]|nr:hypothetical protein M0805_005963 [Coniferiporia weirii]